MEGDDVVPRTFRALADSAEKKFARVRDLPSYGGGAPIGHYFHKVFKAYTRLWKFQQENRAKLVESGLRRWEIGEIASRIGQLYYGQYLRTSEARFLIGSYIFYEAILHRNYFEGSGKDRGVRFKELRFTARFLTVSLILNRSEMVSLLVDRFKDIVDESISTFPGTNFKEWKLVIQELVRFTNADFSSLILRPLRYCALFDTYPLSHPYVNRFHASKVLKFQDALLTSYHKNEVKFAGLTLDTFRMMQCLEWEPSDSFYQKEQPEFQENGLLADQSLTSGLIDVNLGMNSNLPPNPKKVVLYRPSVPHLIAVIAKLVDELPPESLIMLYLSASGCSGQTSSSVIGRSTSSRKPVKPTSQTSQKQHTSSKGGESTSYFEKYLSLGHSRTEGPNNLYPGDLIPFTRRPLFIIVDSDSSHAFKVLHGAERGERCALLLSPLRPLYKTPNSDVMRNGSQFTFFLASPLQAFCELVGIKPNEDDNDADTIISTAFSEWEIMLCTTSSLDLVWAQVLSDPFLRRLLLRFIFCRAVFTLYCLKENGDQYLPVCLPELPDSFSSNSASEPAIRRLATHLNVADCFHLW
ncbi:unnamed protein product [Cuscuta campestris]|uniref:Integrase catalytic domain-containing protein n=1 Tax=Cuscuta campestris TaxID=132261 RepID=A0A484NEE7_9ASTE|nr:unnamed protein product [Cuscuta campestris]